MRLSTVIHAAAALALGCTGINASAEPAPKELTAQIVATTQRMMDAIGEGKADVWEQILADDAVITDEFGRRQNKSEAVSAIHPFPAGFSGSIEVRNPRVRQYGDAVAIDCEAYERETVFGQNFIVRYLFTNTFVRRKTQWQLVAMQDVTLPTQGPLIDVRGLNLADYVGTYRYAPERAWTFAVEGGHLVMRTKPSAPAHVMDPLARDVFMGTDDERNVLIFRRDEAGHVSALIERRKFNDMLLPRDKTS